ncbi:hypothetical protein BSKO_11961 [Bryopsis sp. KO-2023]|nr:hypothetical protein BSKO_11961 [Bryopsis sp. KO-2023]
MDRRELLGLETAEVEVGLEVVGSEVLVVDFMEDWVGQAELGVKVVEVEIRGGEVGQDVMGLGVVMVEIMGGKVGQEMAGEVMMVDIMVVAAVVVVRMVGPVLFREKYLLHKLCFLKIQLGGVFEESTKVKQT